MDSTKNYPWKRQELKYKKDLKNRMGNRSVIHRLNNRHGYSFDLVETSYPKNLLEWSVFYQVYPSQVIPEEYREDARKLIIEAVEEAADRLNELIYGDKDG